MNLFFLFFANDNHDGCQITTWYSPKIYKLLSGLPTNEQKFSSNITSENWHNSQTFGKLISQAPYDHMWRPNFVSHTFEELKFRLWYIFKLMK